MIETAPNPPNDWDLLQVASRDDCALSQLFERHRHFVYRLAWGLLQEDHAADDVVQDVFVKIRAGKLRAKPRAKFTTWLYQVAINTAREQSRKRRRFWGAAQAEDVLAETADGRTGPSELELRDDLRRSLAALPIRQREVVLLRFYEGFDTAETAEILGCRKGTVKAHLHRATLKLRETLKT